MANKSFYDCIGAIQKAAPDLISEKQAEQLLDEIDKVVQAKKANGNLNGLNMLVLDELDNATNAIKEAALIEKRNALLNVAVKKQALAYVANFKNPGEGLMALLGGKHTGATGSLHSIDAQGKATTSGFLGRLLNSLEAENLSEHFASGKFDNEIAQELWELPGGKVGISGSEEAKKIAAIIHNLQNEIVYRQNRAGAFIKLLPGYIVRQSHDMFKIRAVSKEEFINRVFPLLDAQKTFGTMSPTKFLSEAYDGFISGMHFKAQAEDTADSVTYFLGFKGPSNLAKKLSEQRTLHFKDSGSWMKYNEAFGKETLRDSLINGIEHAGRNIALMENLGTNPLRMLDDLIQTLRRQFKDDPKLFDSLKDHNIHNLYMQLDGTAHIPVYHKVAMIGSSIRMVQNLAKLGGAVLSSVTDIPFQAANLRLNGVNILTAYTNAFTNVIRGRGSAEQKEIARLIGVGFDGIIKDIASRFSTNDDVPGFLSKLQGKYFKLNGMNWWNDAHKTGVALVLSNHIAEAPGDYMALPKSLRTVLGQYNIDRTDWALVKDLTWKAEDGHNYFTPDRLRQVEDSRLIEVYSLNKDLESPALSRELRELRDTLETKWRTYFVDQINHAVPHPGAAEHAFTILGGGTQPGTTIGEALRFIGQFKSFPITVIRKGLAPHIYNEGASSVTESLFKGKADYAGLVHLMVATTVFGYMAGMAKDTVRGLPPKDPRDPKTWVSAMAQGGGLGLYGDFLFGEFNKYGHSALASLAGPTLSNVEDVLKLYSRAKEGDKTAGQAMRIAINNAPFANLFYTRAAMDYLFLYQLQESVNPGYLSRLEGRIMKETGRKFYLPPTQQIPYGGGDKLFEGVR